MGRPVGPKGPKSASVSLRLTPRAHFGLALLARVNRLSMSEVVEQALEGLFYGEGPGTLERRVSGAKERVALLDVSWDERAWVRLGKVAVLAPEMLTSRELSLWERLREDAQYWKEGRATKSLSRLESAMNHDALARDWPELSKAAAVAL